jgi:hypothetical protein
VLQNSYSSFEAVGTTIKSDFVAIVPVSSRRFSTGCGTELAVGEASVAGLGQPILELAGTWRA